MLLGENIFASIHNVLICTSQPPNNEVAEEKLQQRLHNGPVCLTPVSADTPNRCRETWTAPFATFNPFKISFMILQSCKISNILKSKRMWDSLEIFKWNFGMSHPLKKNFWYTLDTDKWSGCYSVLFSMRGRKKTISTKIDIAENIIVFIYYQNYSS